MQKILWKKKPDPRYVANPAKGSPHNRGTAVDCTLVGKNGEELEMPTDFDAFVSKAHRDSKKHTARQRANMRVLENAMKRAGFIPFSTEWWHYNDPNWKNCPILNLPL